MSPLNGNRVEDGRLIRPYLGARHMGGIRNIQGNPKSWARHYQTMDGYDAVLHFENDRLQRISYCRRGEDMAKYYATIPVQGWTDEMEGGVVNAVFESMREADRLKDGARLVEAIIAVKIRVWGKEHGYAW